MSNWKAITGLSDQGVKAREAAFEAQMLAMIATEKSPSPVAAPAPTAASALARDAVQICVTEKGQTTLYDLATAPAPVREKISNAWGLYPGSSVPPVITSVSAASAAPPTPTPRPRTLRFAMTLNLLLPGAGQFYLGQRISGSLYASGFCACLVAMLVLFVRAYSQYLQLATNGDILESGNLETMARAFQVGPLATLSVIGTLIYIASAIHLAVTRGHQRPSL